MLTLNKSGCKVFSNGHLTNCKPISKHNAHTVLMADVEIPWRKNTLSVVQAILLEQNVLVKTVNKVGIYLVWDKALPVFIGFKGPLSRAFC